MKEQLHGKHLDEMLYSLKLSRTLPADRNRPDVIEGRQEYAKWFLQLANIHVFVDELGFNIMTARTQGRARVGERAYSRDVQSKGTQHYSLLGGLKPLVWCITPFRWVG